VSEADVIDCVLRRLSQLGRAERMMSEIWRSAGTLRIERGDPVVTAAGKAPALIAARRSS
jgi:hypothetical protein